MYTLYDFVTHIKGVEYILSIMFIAGYILFAEVLKPKPFAALANAAREDKEYIRNTGYRETARTIGKVAAAPFIGIAYVVALPFAFFAAASSAALSGLMNVVGGEAAFGWRPVEAYLAGRKRKKEAKKKDEKKKEDLKKKEDEKKKSEDKNLSEKKEKEETSMQKIETPSSEIDFAPIFAKRCAKCHGKDLKGKKDGGPDLTRTETQNKSDEKLIGIITNGVKADNEEDEDMPSWKSKLSEDEIHAAVKFIKAH